MKKKSKFLSHLNTKGKIAVVLNIYLELALILIIIYSIKPVWLSIVASVLVITYALLVLKGIQKNPDYLSKRFIKRER